MICNMVRLDLVGMEFVFELCLGAFTGGLMHLEKMYMDIKVEIFILGLAMR